MDKGLTTVTVLDRDLSGEQVLQTLGHDVDRLRLTLVLPSHYTFMDHPHHHLHISSSDEDVVYVPPFSIPDSDFDWELPFEVRGEGEAILHLEGQVFFCPVTDDTLCIWASIDDRYHVRVEEGAGRPELVHDIDILECLEHANAALAPAAVVEDEN